MILKCLKSVCVEMQHDGELKYFKDMAGYVKKRVEDEERGTGTGTSGWHVIVGKYTFMLRSSLRDPIPQI